MLNKFDSELQQILMNQKHGLIRTDQAMTKIKELFAEAKA